MLLIPLTTWMLRQELVSKKCLQVVAGRWSRCIQLRREMSCALDETWRVLSRARDLGPRLVKMSQELVDEYTLLIALTPLLIMDLRMGVNSTLTCSDASEDGCGVTRSTYLTQEGRKALKKTESHRPNNLGQDVGVIELFGGIGGLRQALALVGVSPSLHVVAETDQKASRVCNVTWPRAHKWGAVESIDEEKVRCLIPHSMHISVFVIGGGFPTADLSQSHGS